MGKINPEPHTKILDAGFSDDEWSDSSNYLEKHYPYPQQITALGISGDKNFGKRYPLVKSVVYDGVDFPFADKEFDFGWSNAVIEHVAGGRDGQLHFLKELLRTCKDVCFTTPNKYFPIELHTRFPLIHMLPVKIYDRLLHILGKPWADSRDINLLSRRDIIHLCKSAGAKNVEIKGNRLFGFIMDYVVIIRD